METEDEKYLRELLEEQDKFWTEVYPKKTIEEREKHWITEIHCTMRSSGEIYANEYSNFSKDWYISVLESEPNFDEILKKIAQKIRHDFDWNKYNARIKTG